MRIIGILLDDGYKMTRGLGYFSSIIVDGVSSTYKKGDIRVEVGLHEKGYPPCLISPRPICKFKVDDKWVFTRMRDPQIIDWVNKHTDKEVIDFIERHHNGERVVEIFTKEELGI